jgi:hypothetical protein
LTLRGARIVALMPGPPRSRRRQRKKILRRSDGSLYDVSERRQISQAELREFVRDGGFFEARRQGSGSDCTYEVLQGVVGAGFVENLLPGMGSGGPLPGLGALGALGSGSGGLDQLARLFGDERSPRDSDRGYHDEPRRSPRRDRDRRDDWDDRPRRRSEDDFDESDRWDKPPRRSGRRDSWRGQDFEDD